MSNAKKIIAVLAAANGVLSGVTKYFEDRPYEAAGEWARILDGIHKDLEAVLDDMCNAMDNDPEPPGGW